MRYREEEKWRKERARRGSSARAPIQNGQGGRGGLDRGEASVGGERSRGYFLDQGFDAGWSGRDPEEKQVEWRRGGIDGTRPLGSRVGPYIYS